MTKKNNRFKGHNNHRRKSRLRPPYFINKNLHFDIVRKQMKMKTDGPTLNEMSSIDSTGNVGTEDAPKVSSTIRPVSTSNRVKDFLNESWKQIIIGLVVAAFTFFLGYLVYHHGIHLAEHDKDIEYLQKNDAKQDAEIGNIKEKANEISTDMRLMEQHIELTSDKPQTTKQYNKKK